MEVPLAVIALVSGWLIGPQTLIATLVLYLVLKRYSHEVCAHMLQYKNTFMETFTEMTKPSSLAMITEQVTRVPQQQQFHTIKDNYESIDDLKQDLKKSGLESSRMIIGIDFTQSNERNGEKSFDGKSLHDITGLNPYQEVITILGKTLASFDEDGEFLCYGFGDSKTKDKAVCNLLRYNNDRCKESARCKSLNEVLDTYNHAIQTLKLSGPTSFTPLIKKAIETCKQEKQYYVLVIITDGETMTPEEDAQTIVEASNYPISIICVGVGDGPWDTMEEFDDELPKRKFDNFQLVILNEVTKNTMHRDAEFARHALMEIPEQFKCIKSLGYLKKW